MRSFKPIFFLTSLFVATSLLFAESEKGADAKDASAKLLGDLFVEEAAPPPQPELLKWTPLNQSTLSGRLIREKSPYLLSVMAEVPVGKKLTIEPGVVVLVSGAESGLTVRGTLEILGAPNQKVRFASVAERPTPGAWAGIVAQDGACITAHYLQLSHAKNGFVLSGTCFSLSNSVIDNVSASAVFALNSEVQLTQNSIGECSPHALGLYADRSSRVTVTRGRITGVQFGVVATGYSTVNLYDALIESNGTGMMLIDSVAVELQGARIQNNQTGVASTFDAGRKARGLAAALGLFGPEAVHGYPPEVQGNSLDWTRLSAVNARQQLGEIELPPAVQSNLLQIRPKKFIPGVTSSDFVPLEAVTFGSVTVGLEYHNVHTAENKSLHTIEVDRDSVAPGQYFPNRFHVERYKPYISLYSQSRFGVDRVLEVQANVSHDEWSEHYLKPITVRWESPQVAWRLGHFTENGADLVLDAVDLLGASLSLNTATGKKRVTPLLKLNLVVGETVQPLSEGDKNPDLFADLIGPGEARAQGIFMLGRAAFSPINRTELALGYERSIDWREDPWLRHQISDRSELEKPEVDAQAIFAELNWATPRGGFEWRSSAVLGTPDSTQRAWNIAVEEWIDQHNILLEADTLRALLKRSTAPSAAAIQKVLPPMIDLTGYEVIQEIRTIASTVQDSLSEDWVGGIKPSVDHLAFSLGLDWRSASTVLSLDYRFLGREFYSPGIPDLRPNGREYALRWSQGVNEWWDFAFVGKAMVEDASSAEDHLNFFGFGEGSQWGISPDKQALAELTSERVNPRTIFETGVENRWQLPAGFELSLNYDYSYRFRRSPRLLSKDTTLTAGVFADSWFSGSDDSLRYMAHDVGIDTARWGSYLSASDTLANRFRQELLTHAVSAELTKRIGRSSVSLGSHLRWDFDRSDFDHYSQGTDWALADSTWGKMGYRFGQGDGFLGSWPLRINWRSKFLSDRLTLQMRYRKAAENSYNEREFSASDLVEWNVFPGRWTLTAEAGATYRTIGYESDGFYLKDVATGEYYSFIVPDGSGGWNTSSVDRADAVRVDAQTDLDGYELGNRRRYRDNREEEYDFFVSLLSRYALSSTFQLELETRWDDFRRPDLLSEEWNDLSSHLRLIWEF